MPHCWMIPKRSAGGGGNIAAHRALTVRRFAAIGDALCATTVADKLIEQGFAVDFHSHSSIHCVLRRHRGLSSVSTPNAFAHVDLDGAYEKDPARRNKTFHEMFFAVANRQLKRYEINIGQPRNCKPRIVVRDHERATFRAEFEKYEKPWVFICPRSNSYACRQVPDGIWESAAQKIQGTKFWLGTHPAPPGIVDLQARHLDNVILWLSIADLLVTVDTGPMHIAAALNVPIVAINQSSSPSQHLNDQNDFIEISPGGLDCLNCQKNICPKNATLPPCQNIDPDQLAAVTNSRLRSVTTEDVTAVVSIYQPRAEVLNRCLKAVIDQVQEVIVTREEAGILPSGVMTDGKIRFVVKNERGIGYGRNANYGVRNSNGKYVLLLNDDCYLQPGCVESLRREMREGVGMVGHLLKQKDGRIQHGGKQRCRDGIGFGHIDHMKFQNSITEPREVENVTGTSILVRRKAYYDTDGHNEYYHLYTEDDELCMSMRQRGWKIMYTPLAVAIHDEHLSTSKVHNIIGIMNQSNAIFAQRWGKYFTWNKDNPGLGNFDYLKA